MNIKNVKNKTDGVTIVALVVTVIILLIIVGMSVYSGKDTIKKAKLQELKTNMLLIQAKAKEYVEDATFKMGIDPSDEKKTEVREQVYGSGSEEGAQLQKVESSESLSKFGITEYQKETCYWLTQTAQVNWGLGKIELENNEKYLIQFDEDNLMVEIYNTLGYDGKYSLTEIDKIEK